MGKKKESSSGPLMAEHVNRELGVWMNRFKRFQTRGDWEIELQYKWDRRRNYFLAFSQFLLLNGAFAPTEVLMHKERYSQSPFKFFWAWSYTTQRWALPYSRAKAFVAIGVPTIFLAMASHWTENKRLNAYLQQPTFFGAMAREIFQGHSGTDLFDKLNEKYEKDLLPSLATI